MKYLGITFTKEVKDLYYEKNKMLKKKKLKIKQTNKWRDTTFTWIVKASIG